VLSDPESDGNTEQFGQSGARCGGSVGGGAPASMSNFGRYGNFDDFDQRPARAASVVNAGSCGFSVRPAGFASPAAFPERGIPWLRWARGTHIRAPNLDADATDQPQLSHEAFNGCERALGGE